jgi:RNA polymerase sigma-70 factor (ECF subfamily)
MSGIAMLLTTTETGCPSPAARAANPSSSSDQALLARIARGDQLAMRSLFARHQTSIYRWLVRLVRNEAIAEDLLSDVFLDVWRQAGSFQGRSSVSTWLLAIARHKALSARRRRVDDALDDTVAAQMPDPADDPEIALQKKDRSELLRAALSQLSDEHRQVLDLVYYHDRSVKETAEIVGIGEATVKTRMFYARKRLEGLLAAAA